MKSITKNTEVVFRGDLCCRHALLNKLMRVQNDKFEANYYKKLLANYNPGQKLTSAAKQVGFLVSMKP